MTCSSFPNATYAPVAIWLGINFPAGSTNASVHPLNSTVAPINASVVICSPTLGVATVNVTVNLDGMIDHNNIQAYGQDSIFQPTGGLAFNGLSYPLDPLDVRARKYTFPFRYIDLKYIIDKRLKYLQFQFTDAIYAAVINGIDDPELEAPDIREQLFRTMYAIYQVYLSTCMPSSTTSALSFIDTCTFQLLRSRSLCPLIMAAQS